MIKCDCCGKKGLHEIDGVWLCTMHYKHLLIDTKLLLGNRRQVTSKLASEWLERNGDTHNLIFINSYYNETPEKLLLPDRMLNKIDLRNFADKNHINRRS